MHAIKCSVKFYVIVLLFREYFNVQLLHELIVHYASQQVQLNYYIYYFFGMWCRINLALFSCTILINWLVKIAKKITVYIMIIIIIIYNAKIKLLVICAATVTKGDR